MSDKGRTSLNVRVTFDLKDRIDEAVEERSFANRSEYVRSVLRDALEEDSDLPAHLREGAEASDPEEALSLEEIRDRVDYQEVPSIDTVVRTSLTSEEIESDLGFKETLSSAADDDFDVRIFGCGGGGIRIVDELHDIGFDRGQTITVDTDRGDLEAGQSDTSALIGKDTFDGTGAEGDFEDARESIERAEWALEELVGDPDLVFVIGGLGGATGTALAPKISEIASETDAVVVGIGTLPFRLESAQMERAREGLEMLSDQTDTFAVLDGNRLTRTEPALPFGEALEKMNADVATVVSQISHYIGDFRVSKDDQSLLSMLEDGGNSILLHEVVSSDEDYHALSDRLLQFTNVDIESEHIEQAILMFTGGQDVSSDLIDEVVKTVGQFTDEVAWTAHRSKGNPDALSVTGLLTGVDVSLDDLFYTQTEHLGSRDQQGIEIIPPSMDQTGQASTSSTNSEIVA